MRVAIAILGFAAFAYVLCCRNASAVAIDGAAIKGAADASSSPVQLAFYGRTHRNYVVKCYRQLVVGPYVCRRYYRF